MNRRGPNFDDLVEPEFNELERERLRRVHELLVTVEPLPELSSKLAPPRVPYPVRLAPQRRRGALVALAAVFGISAFGLGLVLGDGGQAPSPDQVIALSGTKQARGVTASIALFEPDAAGNWPMELTVNGLVPSTTGRPYELWLMKRGKLAAFCGRFLAEADGSTVVPMNAPYKLKEYGAWVIVRKGSKVPLLTT